MRARVCVCACVSVKIRPKIIFKLCEQLWNAQHCASVEVKTQCMSSHMEYTWIIPGIYLDYPWVAPGLHLDYIRYTDKMQAFTKQASERG